MHSDLSGDEEGWDPAAVGLKVRLRDNPGRQGMTTGRTKAIGSFLMVEIDFGPNEKQYKRYDRFCCSVLITGLMARPPSIFLED